MRRPTYRLHPYVLFVVILFLSVPLWADQVVFDDQIVSGSLCAGVDCIDGEDFGFDTIRIKSSNPQIHFEDTSNSASFPTNDWLMGISDDITTESAFFYITDVSSNKNVLLIQATDTGGVALGAGSEVMPNAISVGAPAMERPIVNVAPGINPTDAVNRTQFDDFTQQVEVDNASEIAAVEAAVAAAQVRIDTLNTRVDDLMGRVNALLKPTP